MVALKSQQNLTLLQKNHMHYSKLLLNVIIACSFSMALIADTPASSQAEEYYIEGLRHNFLENHEQAKSYFSKAALRDHTEAQVWLGSFIL